MHTYDEKDLKRSRLLYIFFAAVEYLRKRFLTGIPALHLQILPDRSVCLRLQRSHRFLQKNVLFFSVLS